MVHVHNSCSPAKRSKAVTLTAIWVNWKSLCEIRQTQEDKYAFSHMRNLDLNVCTSTCLSVCGGGGSGKGSWEQTMRSAGRREGRRKRQRTVCGLYIVCMCHEGRLFEGGREK